MPIFKNVRGGLKFLVLLFALMTAVSASIWFTPRASAADQWENIYSCANSPIATTPCGGSGWSCTWSHDGDYGTNPDGTTLRYHFYRCTWSGGSSGGGTTNPGGGTTTPTKKNYTLEYDANGGSGAPSKQTYQGENDSNDFKVSTTQPQRTNYKFLGWSTSKSGSAAYGYGTGQEHWVAVPANQTVTLYAIWNAFPTISVKNQTITLEQAKTWNPLDGVTASDKEDGNLTAKILSSPVEKPANMETTTGKYTFHYSVTDSNGNTATATRVITVIANQLTDMPSTGVAEFKPLMVVAMLIACGLLVQSTLTRKRLA